MCVEIWKIKGNVVNEYIGDWNLSWYGLPTEYVIYTTYDIFLDVLLQKEKNLVKDKVKGGTYEKYEKTIRSCVWI